MHLSRNGKDGWQPPADLILPSVMVTVVTGQSVYCFTLDTYKVGNCSATKKRNTKLQLSLLSKERSVYRYSMQVISTNCSMENLLVGQRSWFESAWLQLIDLRKGLKVDSVWWQRESRVDPRITHFSPCKITMYLRIIIIRTSRGKSTYSEYLTQLIM